MGGEKERDEQDEGKCRIYMLHCGKCSGQMEYKHYWVIPRQMK